MTIAVESLFLDMGGPLKWGLSRSGAEPDVPAQHRQRRAKRQPLKNPLVFSCPFNRSFMCKSL